MTQNDRPLVLITGASGFLAGHVIKQALADGYRVRGTVRNASAVDRYKYIFDMGEVELVSADLTSDSGWDEAVSNVDYIIHTASPFIFDGTEEQMIGPAVKGTGRVLEAAKRESQKNGKLQRVVVTSSSRAIYCGHFDKPQGHVFSPKDWSINEGSEPYAKSKHLAEKFAREFVEKEDCGFEFCTVNPDFIFGPLLNDREGESSSFLKHMMTAQIRLVNVSFCVVDVRDVALVHVRALTAPEAPNKRLICATRPWRFAEIAEVLRERYEEQGFCIASTYVPDWILKLVAYWDSDAAQMAPYASKDFVLDASETERIIGFKFREMESSFIDTVESLLEKKLLVQPEPSESPASNCVLL